MTMNTAEATPGRLPKVLAILSVACFWLLPYAPMVAIGAVATTRESPGWPRKLAVAGAALCASYTIALALLMVWLVLKNNLGVIS